MAVVAPAMTRTYTPMVAAAIRVVVRVDASTIHF
jgi:hypothetical protein